MNKTIFEAFNDYLAGKGGFTNDQLILLQCWQKVVQDTTTKNIRMLGDYFSEMWDQLK